MSVYTGELTVVLMTAVFTGVMVVVAFLMARKEDRVTAQTDDLLHRKAS